MVIAAPGSLAEQRRGRRRCRGKTAAAMTPTGRVPVPDAETFLGFLIDAASRTTWRCLAYCLMPNHYHLLVETPQPNLSAGMHRLNARYARAFNLRYGHQGHLFQRRFDAVLVDSERHLLEALRYIALNPVRARLCREPEEWRWSSYPAAIRGSDPRGIVEPDRVLALFSKRQQRARCARSGRREAAPG
jgi:putative transposase